MASTAKLLLNFVGDASSVVKSIMEVGKRMQTLQDFTKTANVQLKVTEEQIRKIAQQQGLGWDEAKIKATVDALMQVDGVLDKLVDTNQKVTVTIDDTQKELEQSKATWKDYARVALEAGRQLMQSKLFNPDMRAIQQQWQKTLNALKGNFTTFFNGIRLISQGAMSAFRALAISVAAPIGFALQGLIRTAIDFEDALVRVQKTTGKTADEMEIIEAGIRSFSQTTVSSQTELATMAEQIGQLGVRSIPSIDMLIRLFEKLVVATDIGADTIAASMGRIANAFGIDLDTEQGISDITRLSNVINKLENETASTASQIVAALENFAPTAGLLRITSADAAALSAALIEMGISADAAGTRLGAMLQFMVRNKTEIAELMAGVEGYVDEIAVLNMINEDAVGVLQDIIKEMGTTGHRAEALSEIFGALGRVGGKAAGSLSANWERVGDIIGIAQDEFQRALSLEEEYQTALQSTASQLKLARNVWNELGITLGEAFLPLINEVLPVVVEGVKFLTQLFSELEPEVQRTVIVVALLSAVLAPVLFFVSQIAFGLSMMLLGVFKVGAGIMGLVGFLGQFLKLILVVGKAGPLMFVGIIVGAGILLKALQDLGIDVASFFENLATSARNWGNRLVEEWADGLLTRAVQVITRVLSAIGNMIARFLRGSSPPPEGPLSTIDQWGVKVMEAYLQGFTNADFGILSQVGNIIKRIFENFRLKDMMSKVASLEGFAKARAALANLISTFNKTGEISQSLMSQVTKGLGDMAGHVSKLIRLWLEYNRIQKQIADIEKARQIVLKNFEGRVDDIMGSGMTPEEKAEAIRQAMLDRNEELRILDDQEEALQEQKAELESQLEWQKSFIDALLETEDIMIDIKEALEEIADKLGGIGDVGFGTDLEDTFEEFKTGLLDILEVQNALNEGWMKFQALLAGLKGEPMPDFGPAFEFPHLADDMNFMFAGEGGLTPIDIPDVGAIEQWYDWGTKIRDVYDEITGKLDEIGGHLETVVGYFDELFGTEGGIKEDSPVGQLLKLGGSIGIILLIGRAILWISGLFSWVPGVVTSLAEMGITWAAIKAVLGPVAVLLGAVALAFIAVGGAGALLIAGLLALLIGNWGRITEWWENTVIPWLESLPETWEEWGELIGKAIVEGIPKGFNNLMEWLKESWATFSDGVIKFFKGRWGVESPSTIFEQVGEDVVQGFINGILNMIEGAKQAFTDLSDGVITAWNTFWRTEGEGSQSGKMITLGENIIGSLITGFLNKAQEWYQTIRDIVAEVFKLFQPAIDLLSGNIGGGGSSGGGGGGSQPKEFGSSDDGGVPWVHTGGIAVRPVPAVVGDRGAEAIIPLNRLPGMMAQMIAASGTSFGNGGGVEMNFHIGSIRDETDIRKFAREIERIVIRNLRSSSKY